MATASANGISIEYDTFGQASDPALLLVMGLGSQLTVWDPAFCTALASRGFYVIRYDNRDVGLSTKMEDAPRPEIGKAFQGDFSSASYTLWDMAEDAVGLLDYLGITRAHIVGASMGGMIVQAMAIKHPNRVLTMTSIMSSTGNPQVGQPKPEGMSVLMAPPPSNREDAIEQTKRTMNVIGSPSYPTAEELIGERAAAEYDRCFYPIGTARQLLASMATGDRTEALREVRVPTLVLHGEEDPLISVSGGKATAEAIPGATLITIPGMGHDLPTQLYERLIDAIVENTRRALPTP